MPPLAVPALRAGVIGWPIQHSRSPVLHGFWLRAYGIDGSYDRFAVAPENLAAFIADLRGNGMRGVNVTIPHKVAVMDLLDTVTDEARVIGAVNTIVVHDGKLRGSNTDAFGFIENLRAGAPAVFSIAAGPALVLGTGGAARAVVYALLTAGAPEIRLANRDAPKCAWFVERFGPRIVPVKWKDREIASAGTNLLVNTTSLGMSSQPPLTLALDRLPDAALVHDIVYNPLVTPLLAAATARGNPVVDGLGMLLHQARPGFAAWFGRAPDVTPALREAVLGA
jgi:shikimate dehydrogenase